MGDFVKVKTRDGNGNKFVRKSSIYVVYDDGKGATIEAEMAGERILIKTASTAEQVVAAIEERQ